MTLQLLYNVMLSDEPSRKSTFCLGVCVFSMPCSSVIKHRGHGLQLGCMEKKRLDNQQRLVRGFTRFAENAGIVLESGVIVTRANNHAQGWTPSRRTWRSPAWWPRAGLGLGLPRSGSAGSGVVVCTMTTSRTQILKIRSSRGTDGFRPRKINRRRVPTIISQCSIHYTPASTEW